MSLKRLLYSLVLYLLFPLVLLRLLWRSRAKPKYRKRWSERLGFVKQFYSPKSNKKLIWVHAVSVGEAIAVKPLIQDLLDSYDGYQLLMTTTTPTGSDRVSAMFDDQIKQRRLIHVYFPYDLLGAVSRFVTVFQPRILIVVETEIWPNLYAQCHQQNIPVMMVNARLSEKSTQSYLKIKGLILETLAKVNIIAVRSKSDAERFMLLGAKPEQIQQIGNIKYDTSIDEKQVSAANKLVEKWNMSKTKKRPVFVGASTHAGEDEKIISAYLNLSKKFPDLLLILVPRHPERFDEVYEKCRTQLPKDKHLIRYSNFNDSIEPNIHVILGDSMGDMQMWYATADIVFIGGSLVNTGGHNPLEATVFGVPVVSGPHMFNFEDIVSELSEAGLLYVCNDETEITNKVASILTGLGSNEVGNSDELDYSMKAGKFMQKHRGVSARLLMLVKQMLMTD